MCYTNVQGLYNSEIFGLQIKDHPSETALSKKNVLIHVTGKSRANRAELGGSDIDVRAFSLHLLALLFPALAATLCRLFFHSGKILNLFSGQEKEDALLGVTVNIPGLRLIMSHAHPWTNHWGQEESNVLTGLGLGHVLNSEA